MSDERRNEFERGVGGCKTCGGDGKVLIGLGDLENCRDCWKPKLSDRLSDEAKSLIDEEIRKNGVPK